MRKMHWLTGLFLIFISSLVSAEKIFLIGDSTVANYTAGYYPQTGWGQVLQPHFDANRTIVDNRAIGGTSSKSFYNNNWAAVKANIRAGDYLIIQFGINDRNSADPARYAPAGVFEQYLTSFVNETKALGAYPILVATLVRNAWTADGKVYAAYHEHPILARNLAATLKVPLIDLDMASTALLTAVGQEYSTNFLYMNLAAGEYPNFSAGRADNVHLQQMGAVEMARLAAESLRKQTSFPEIKRLVDTLKPTFNLSVASSVVGAGLVTKSRSYPAGTPLTLKARLAAQHSFTGWLDASYTMPSTALIYRLTMPAAHASFAAVFDQKYPPIPGTSSIKASSSKASSSKASASSVTASKTSIASSTTASKSSISVSSVSNGTISSSLTIMNDWGSGYCATLNLVNSSAQAKPLKIQITIDGSVTSIWNGTWSQSGNLLTITGLSWNSTLQPWEANSSIGFCVTR
jgi:lysophospholipase L1-like esterase